MSAPEPDELAFISYAEFGQRFFEIAVTQERVEGAVAGLAGRPVEVGPTGVGPLGLIKVQAQGTVGEPTVERLEGEHVAFTLTIPVSLQMAIELGLDKYRFTAVVRVHVGLTARAADRLRIAVDIEPPTHRTIDVDLQADGVRASVVQVLGNVEGEIKKAVAKFVRREIDKPELRAARIIDVEAALHNLSLKKPATQKAANQKP